MRAAVIRRVRRTGRVRVVDVDTPVPGPKEVLVRVHATAVTAADSASVAPASRAGSRPFARLAFGLRRPRRSVLGNTSPASSRRSARGHGRRVGDEVAGTTGLRMGTHAE